MLTASKVKTNSGARLFVVGYVAMSLAANAQFFSPVPGPDASDIWMRNQIMNLGAEVNVVPAPASTSASDPQSVSTYGLDASDAMFRKQLADIGTVNASGSAEDGTLSGKKAGKMMNDAFTAIGDGEWEDGLDRLIDYINATRNSPLEADLNRAQNYLFASMLCWNIDKSEKAREFLDKSIRLMRNGENLGGGCEVRAVAFREKMLHNRLPRRFTSRDIMGSTGVQSYIMELPTARFKGTLAAMNARYEVIGGMADTQKSMYEAQRRWFETSSKFYARQEYQNATHRTFDPDRPPEYGTSDREHWEAAKRIYDIFGK